MNTKFTFTKTYKLEDLKDFPEATDNTWVKLHQVMRDLDGEMEYLQKDKWQKKISPKCTEGPQDVESWYDVVSGVLLYLRDKK
jgi:hypothetical protein